MPSHWGSPALHIVTQSSATGSQCLPAVGCAEAGRYIATHGLPGIEAHADEVTYVSLGEGATSEGEFWESLNTACRLRLPVVYVVEDNGFAISVPAADQAPAPISTSSPASPASRSWSSTAATTSPSATLGAEAIEPGALRGRARPHPRPRRAAALALVVGRRDEVPPRRRHRRGPRPRPRAASWATSSSTRGFLDESRAAAIRDEAHAAAAEAGRDALRAAKPDPASATAHVWQTSGAAGAAPRRCPTASSSLSARRSAARCTR